MNYQELERKLESLEKSNEEMELRIVELETKLQGTGVIQNNGNRLKIDISANLSDFAKKSS